MQELTEGFEAFVAMLDAGSISAEARELGVAPDGGAALIADLPSPVLDPWREVRLELLAATRHVDLVAEEAAVALPAGDVRDPSLIARRQWSPRRVAVASPADVRAHGLPARPPDLREHASVLGVLGVHAGLPRQERWPLLDGRRCAAVSPAMIRACSSGPP